MEPPCDIASMPRFGKQSQSGRVSSVKFPVLRRARRWSGLQTLHVTLQTWPKAGCTNKPNWPATPGGRRNSRFVGGDGVLARRTQNTVLAHVVFWAGAPKNAVLGPRHGVYLARGTWRDGFLGQKRGEITGTACGEATECAEQSQLPEAEHRGGVEELAGMWNTQCSTIPLFQRSSSMPNPHNTTGALALPV